MLACLFLASSRHRSWQFARPANLIVLGRRYKVSHDRKVYNKRITHAVKIDNLGEPNEVNAFPTKPRKQKRQRFRDSNDTRSMVAIDLSHPHLWYAEARAIKRKIICHVGPTNSGI